MQGLSRGRPAMGDLQHLRKSIVWASQSSPQIRKGALQERLEEILVMELHKEGGRAFLNFTVRGLYKHVLKSITSKISGKRERDEVQVMIQKKGSKNKATMGETISSPVVLGALSSHHEDDEEDDHTGREGTGQHEESESSHAELKPVTEGSTQATKSPEIPNPAPDVRPAISEMTMKANNATYRERLGGYLHPRDMRRLVTPFSASNEPGLIVRRHAMLLNFDPLRAVILKDRLLVIVPDGADSILVQLEKRVRGGIIEMERSFLGAASHISDDDVGLSQHSKNGRVRKFVDSVLDKGSHHGSQNQKHQHGSSDNGKGDNGSESRQSTNHSEAPSDVGTEATHIADEYYSDAAKNGDDSEWNDLRGSEWIDLPFELQCTDAVLHTVSNFLSGDTLELQEASTEYIYRILKDHTATRDDPLTIIRAVKEAVREMSGRVKGFVQSMNRILDEDEDMALMNLTRLQTHPERFMYPVSAEVLEEESDEPELILESYLQEGLSLVNVLDSIQGQIDTAAELVDQRLDSARNRILMANMVLTSFSVSVSVASLVGSLFGMNVPVPYEDDNSAFRKIVFGTLAASIGINVIILFTLFYSGTIPKIGITD